MRVLFVSQRLPPEHVSGAPLQAIQLARALAPLGVEVTILTSRFARGQQTGAFRIGGVRAHRLPTLPEVRASYAALAASFVRRRDFDLVHGHALSASCLGAAIASRVPVLLKPSLGGPTGDLAAIRRSPLAPLLRRLLERADRFAVIDPTIAGELTAFGVPEVKLSPAKNAVDLDRFRPDGPRLALPRPFVLFVGRPIARKRIDLLMSAWSRIAGVRRDATLVFAGPGSPTQGERVVALGVRDDVDALMRTAAVLVLPSSHEGMSNVLLEAIATGLPVVTAGARPPPELAASVTTVDPTPGALAGALLAALDRPRPAPPAAIRSYGLEEVAREYLALYRRMIDLPRK